MTADRLRALMTWMLFGAGVVFSALSVWVDYNILFGVWSPAVEQLRLQMLGYKSMGYALGMIFVSAALAIGGPVSRFSLKAGRDGFEATADGDEPGAAVVTTTRTEVKTDA